MKLIYTHILLFLAVFVCLSVSEQAMANICNRSPGVYRSLEDAVGKSCSEIKDEDLLSVTFLVVWTQKLQKDDFRGLKNLEVLELQVSDLEGLPECLFCDLKKLQDLGIVSETPIRDMSHVGLEYLSELTDMTLIIPGLEVNPDFLRMNKKLVYLRFEEVNLSKIDSDFLKGLNELEEVAFNECHLKQLPEGFFRDQQKLFSLELVGNHFSNGISNEAMPKPEQLKVLALDWGSIKDEYFYLARNLLGLAIVTPQMEVIPSRLFSSMSTLHTLVFLVASPNSTDSVSEELLVGLTKLQKIVIKGGALKTLPVNLFRHSKDLKQVLFLNNHMEFLPPGFFEGMFQFPDSEYTLLALGGNNFSLEEQARIKQEIPSNVNLEF